MYKVKEQEVYRLYTFNREKVLVSISYFSGNLKIKFLNTGVKKEIRLYITNHIWNWFDLSRNLSPFYKIAKEDPILQGLVKKYSGLRMIRIPNLFEALSWAIIGQQINLTFAFSVKASLIKLCGSSLKYQGEMYYSFPTPEKILTVSMEKLKKIKFSQRKSEYIKEVAKQIVSLNISNDLLKDLSYEESFKKLVSIRGVGPWTADYVLMKTFGHTQAFPTGDAGLQNAVKGILNLKKKPSEKELRKIAKSWSGWEAYSTFYLWRSLYK